MQSVTNQPNCSTNEQRNHTEGVGVEGKGAGPDKFGKWYFPVGIVSLNTKEQYKNCILVVNLFFTDGQFTVVFIFVGVEQIKVNGC